MPAFVQPHDTTCLHFTGLLAASAAAVVLRCCGAALFGADRVKR